MEANPLNDSSDGPVGSRDDITEQDHESRPKVKATVIKGVGDIQLYVVRGEYLSGKIWELPIFAEPFEDDVDHERYWRVEPAVNHNNEQYSVLAAQLRPHRLGCDSDHIIISNASLQEIAYKAAGITPSYYVKWNKQFAKTLHEQSTERLRESKDDTEADRFLRFVCERTGIARLPQLRLYWRAIAQEALVWMVEKNRPIDLGFCRLVPLPYRRNWKEVLMGMHPNSVHILNQWKRHRPKMEALLTEMGVTPDLVNSLLLAMQPHHNYIHWSIECVPTKSWDRAVEDIGLRRRGCSTPVIYTEHVRSAMFAKVQESISALVRWVLDTSRPAGAVDDGRTFGSTVLRSWIPKGLVAPRASPVGPARVVCTTGGTEIAGPIVEGPTGDEVEVLPPVSDLPSPVTHVRVCAGMELPAPEVGGETDGVRLPDTDKGP